MTCVLLGLSVMPTIPTPIATQGTSQTSALSLAQTMRRSGWEIAWVDLDTTSGSPTIDIGVYRVDGLWVQARVDALGRASLERFHRQRKLVMGDGQRGRRPLSPTLDDVFMGRDRFAGWRALLEGLSLYLADNAIAAVSLVEMQGAWSELMSSQGHAALASLE